MGASGEGGPEHHDHLEVSLRHGEWEYSIDQRPAPLGGWGFSICVSRFRFHGMPQGLSAGVVWQDYHQQLGYSGGMHCSGRFRLKSFPAGLVCGFGLEYRKELLSLFCVCPFLVMGKVVFPFGLGQFRDMPADMGTSE